MSPLERASQHFGSQAALARALGVTPMAVSQWKKRGIPPWQAVAIEQLTGGEINRRELCPAMFETFGPTKGRSPD